LDETVRKQFAEAGAKGGFVRAARLTANRRAAIARKAAKARWSKKYSSRKEGL